MNIAVAHIIYFSDESYEVEARRTDERFILAGEIMKDISSLSCDIDLLILPAGYFVSPRHDDCFGLAERLASKFSSQKYAVAFGVNHEVCRGNFDRNSYDYSHGFVAGPGGKKLVWGVDQLGARRRDRIQSNEINDKRIFELAGLKVGLLLCGEMNSIMEDVDGNPRMSEYLARESDFVVNLTHADIQLVPSFLSWFPAMRDMQRPCVVAEHIWNDYLGDRRYSQSSERGIDYSCGAGVIASKMTSKYNLVTYSIA